VKFIDEVSITVQAGDGGRGCVSFRREKYIPRGGPNGGDGGDGGDVVLRSSSRGRNLFPFRYKRLFKAPNGAHGQGKQKAGRKGIDLVIEIPAGTLVKDADTHQVLKDFTKPDEVFIIAKGGRGGKGNTHFKSATHRTPRFAQPGEPGQTLKLRLELKLLADVGLIGLPNAGKSTLLSVISSASPKIADYPFTTLTPNLGVVQVGGGEPFVVADIPGLIDGAHQGAGLGIRFLRHIERTRILVHLIDAAAIDPEHPLEACETVHQEMRLYSPQMAEKLQILVLNKMDIPGTAKTAKIFQAASAGKPVILISAVTKKGVDQLLSRIIQLLGDDVDERQNRKL
jgi:GTP-binding protein